MSDRPIAAEPTTGSDGPRLSMLIPCWNASATIERALTSVLDEHALPFECIVIDDGSTDGTADIVQAVADRDPRVVLIRLPTNVGVSAARNHGLASMRGEWVAFHDADDRMLPGWLEALMRPPRTRPSARSSASGSGMTGSGRGCRRCTTSPTSGSRAGSRSPRIPGSSITHPRPARPSIARCSSGLRFEGRVLGDQAWTIRALLRAAGTSRSSETVFEWSRPRSRRIRRDDHHAGARLRAGLSGDGRDGPDGLPRGFRRGRCSGSMTKPRARRSRGRISIGCSSPTSARRIRDAAERRDPATAACSMR